MLLAGACLWAAPDNQFWEPGRVVAVDQISTPAREPDPSCRNLPKGATPPSQCRASSLAAQHFWRVTVEAGNKHFVVLPYKAPRFLDSLNPSTRIYVDPDLKPGAMIEISVESSK